MALSEKQMPEIVENNEKARGCCTEQNRQIAPIHVLTANVIEEKAVKSCCEAVAALDTFYEWGVDSGVNLSLHTYVSGVLSARLIPPLYGV